MCSAKWISPGMVTDHSTMRLSKTESEGQRSLSSDWQTLAGADGRGRRESAIGAPRNN